MEALMLLLFKPGFTVNHKEGMSNDTSKKNLDFVWKAGCFCAPEEVPNNFITAYNTTRISCMKLLLILVSFTMYNTTEDYLCLVNPFCAFLTNKQTKNLETFVISILNIYLKYDPTGYELPYLSKINYDGDNEMMVRLSIHLLIVLAEYKPPTQTNVGQLIEQECQTIKKISGYYGEGADLTFNRVANILRSIEDPSDLTYIANSYLLIFNNLQISKNTYLPLSIIETPWYHESIILFWRVLHSNPRVLQEVI